MWAMDPTAFHLLQQLVRKGILDLEDCEEMAARLSEEGQDDDAHAVRAAWFEASGPTVAEERRANFSVVQMVPRVKLGPDGGNAA